MPNEDGLYASLGGGQWAHNVEITSIKRELAFSTTTPLGANAVYTSPTIDAINYKVCALSVLSDIAGSYVTQYSDNGIDWVGLAGANVTANSMGGNSGLAFYRRYFRVIYTNGATAQTSFNLSLYLSPL